MNNRIRIYEGWFFNANHTGDDGRNYCHPFLAIGIKKNKLVALQFTSVNYDNYNNSESYVSKDAVVQYKTIPVDTIFGRINQTRSVSNIIDADVTHGLKHHSQANTNKLLIFDLKNQEDYKFKLLKECEDEKWKEIITLLQSNEWDSSIVNELVQQW